MVHKSSAQDTIERTEVNFGYKTLDFIDSEFVPFFLENVNGEAIYVFPSFVIQVKKSGLHVTDFVDLRFNFYKQRFLEKVDLLPEDARRVGNTWAKVNKDGGPDRRFSENYQIPIVLYGAFEFEFPDQIKEIYYISNIELAEQFAHVFESYLAFSKVNRHNKLIDLKQQVLS